MDRARRLLKLRSSAAQAVRTSRQAGGEALTGDVIDRQVGITLRGVPHSRRWLRSAHPSLAILQSRRARSDRWAIRERRERRRESPTRSSSRIIRRTGAPVTVARRKRDPSNVTADAAAKRAVRALARPGRRSKETTTIGMRSRRAASTAGRLAYPPTDTTTRGCNWRSNCRAVLVALASFGRKAPLARSCRRCTPTTSRNVWGYGRLGEQSGLDAALGADVVQRGGRVTALLEFLGNGERRQHVASRASARDDRKGAHRRASSVPTTLGRCATPILLPYSGQS